MNDMYPCPSNRSTKGMVGVSTSAVTAAPNRVDLASTASKVAHTLTACTRCRRRKTRCDPGLPRCTPCDRSNAVCEYWDPARRQNLNRTYVVWLETRIRDLEVELDRIGRGIEDNKDDPESMIRNPAKVQLHDTDDARYLGPSSGTQLTRLVMKLAKSFTVSRSIREIIPDARAKQIRRLYEEEAVKPTSKIYPLVSDVAAVELPNRDLTDLLVQLYNLKVQPMYPALHEPTFAADVDAVYQARGNDQQNFILRMVIAISLQKMDSQYAGLADSYYLAALEYLEAVVAPMNLKTLQAFALIAEYSLLTPTRTAIYFVIGIAVRLAQVLGITQERTISLRKDGSRADPLEIDMRRRIFWCIFVMEAGLSHALGRPDCLAVDIKHLDVGFFATCADEDITPQGFTADAPRTIKKWISVHFFKMRLLQLEIRETLYLSKRETPVTDQDPWFHQMLDKLQAWRDASPDNDQGISLDKVWFIGRYNTMISLLYRPSPQIPTPSVDAALHCFEAARFNLFITREQLRRGNVDLTWIFTQAIFMAINTLLWSLSYAEVRRQHSKAEVESHLTLGMESIELSSTRWPGVSSAHQLYTHIIEAVLRIYGMEGDLNLQVVTPSDLSSPQAPGSDAYGTSPSVSPAPNSPLWSAHSRSDGALSSAGPQDNVSTDLRHLGQGYVSHDHLTSPVAGCDGLLHVERQTTRNESPGGSSSTSMLPTTPTHQTFLYHEALPPFQAPFMTAAAVHQRSGKSASPFNPTYMLSPISPSSEDHAGHEQLPSLAPDGQIYASEYVDPQYWSQIVNESHGLNALQQAELMQSLAATGVNDIESMIEASNRFFNPQRTGG